MNEDNTRHESSPHSELAASKVERINYCEALCEAFFDTTPAHRCKLAQLGDEQPFRSVISTPWLVPLQRPRATRARILPLSEASSVAAPSLMRRSPKLRDIKTYSYSQKDATGFVPDFYSNLLDWGGSANSIVTALQGSVYTIDVSSGAVEEPFEMKGQGIYISSLRWLGRDACFAAGTAAGDLLVWNRAIDNFGWLAPANAHEGARITALDWSVHRGLLATGSCATAGGGEFGTIEDDNTDVPPVLQPRGIVREFDMRVATQQSCVTTLDATAAGGNPASVVCGLKYSPDGRQLAVGYNSNHLVIWDTLNMSRPLHIFADEHKGAVRAIDWHPTERHSLVTGGGAADCCIKFWDTGRGVVLGTASTGAQVCSVLWSRNNPNDELISAHGYIENNLVVWSYPTMTRLANLTGHTDRPLHMAISPDGRDVASLGDDKLRLWRVFDAAPLPSPQPKSVKRTGHIPILIR
jgi:cell division cycle protein 20 (cofactor of APC complex)